MNLAEKIYEYRRQNNLSQEQLANLCDVSRQSVSKWESGQSQPEIDKIIKLAEIFHISVDSLLKDESHVQEGGPILKTIPLTQVDQYLGDNKKFASSIAIGVMMFVFSPVLLIVLQGYHELKPYQMSEVLATALGLVAVFVFVVIGIAIVVPNSLKQAKYKWVKESQYRLESDTLETVSQQKDDFYPSYILSIVIGIILCIVGCVPIMVLGILEVHDGYVILCCGLFLMIVSFAVYLFVKAGIRIDGFNSILEYKENKQKKTVDLIEGIYWPIVVIIYFSVSFIFKSWAWSWIIFVIAGLFSEVIETVVKMKHREK